MGVDDKKKLVNINDNLNNNKLEYLFEMHKEDTNKKDMDISKDNMKLH